MSDARPSSLPLEEAKKTLAASAPDARAGVAAQSHADREILHYLSADPEAAVRVEVAKNENTGEATNLKLTDDIDPEVRTELARKIGRLLPNLRDGDAERLSDLTLATLDKLSRDQLPRVRQALAEELKRSRNVPNAILLRLARDLKSIVSAPILEYSPLLADDDLIELIGAGLATERLEAVARRKGLSENVSDKIAATLDVPAVAALLRNKDAQVRAETLERLAEEAEAIAEWHEPLAVRPELSLRAIRRISEFVAAELVELLAERTGLDAPTRDALRKRTRERVADQSAEEEDDETRVARLIAEAEAGEGVNEAFVTDALGRKDRAATKTALAKLSGLPQDIVDKMIAAKTAKAICALFWKAGLSMRAALSGQEVLAGLAPSARMLPKDGVDYPMTDEELNWMVGYFADAA
ncbi:MAG: DUF2336 domain-containing protein [Pseudomonadota bacterium]